MQYRWYTIPCKPSQWQLGLSNPQGGGGASSSGGSGSAPLGSGGGAKSIKMNKPEKFDGMNTEKMSEFITAVKMYLWVMAPNASNDKKISFIISYLTSLAHLWVQA